MSGVEQDLKMLSEQSHILLREQEAEGPEGADEDAKLNAAVGVEHGNKMIMRRRPDSRQRTGVGPVSLLSPATSLGVL